jgi:hypothetical protein
MLLIVPQVTLVLAAALALLNLWLSVRVGQVRRSEKVSVGDGGNDRVIRRMRAHANFGENAWVVLALVFAIELSVGPSYWLWAAALLFVVARVLHGLGMDGWLVGRGGGTGITMLVQLLLAIWAAVIAAQAGSTPTAPGTEMVMPQG